VGPGSEEDRKRLTRFNSAGPHRFRGKFVAALKHTFRDGQLRFHGDLTPLAQPKTFSSWLRPLFRKDWVVYSRRPFGGPEHVLHYLGRYTRHTIPAHISTTPSFHSIPIGAASLAERPPSSRCIVSAQPHCARVCILPTRASDTTLGLLRS
jgi:putative transposase